ncbi:MAG: hypothetical protein FWF59_14355 [Turicibacter sp.]|nr:hypothetical protein [Turicibacter sp.]
MLRKQSLTVESRGFFYQLSTAILYLGWMLVLLGIGIVLYQLLPIVMEWQRMFNDGYGIIHGEWVSPESYEFLKPFIR